MILGKPVIQQRILPSPAVSIDLPAARPTYDPMGSDENTNIILRPWKIFGPFVDTVQIRNTGDIPQWDVPVAARAVIHGAPSKSFDTSSRLECSRRSGHRPRTLSY
ncbi:hypothetical protein EVAR_52631_1 [Eumeta japonica]|uniref:Uncharacterized protein n=1 Tax=Eumeta variegata TaxID=151549 RepID=A0A4C1XZ19_EUMVA|nr:hypothetical protein EVAR_52631_1 [Eumeta japonica]